MLALDLLAAHLIGDFVLQSHTVATRKLTDWRIRTYHVALYCLPFLLVLWVNHISAFHAGFIFLTHFTIDSQRWASPPETAVPASAGTAQRHEVSPLAVLTHIIR